MNLLEVNKNIAIARGEALGAQLLATVAIQMVLARALNRDDLLDQMSAYVDHTLNRSTSGKGDPDDEPNTLMRETARNMALQCLDAIRRGLPGSD